MIGPPELQFPLHAAQRGRESPLIEWLQQVVERVYLKCPQSVAVISSHKDDDGHILNADLFNHVKSVHLRNFDIEKHEIGLQRFDLSDRSLTVAGDTNHLNLRIV